MRKTFRLFLALAFCAFGAMNASAGERFSLSADWFHSYDGFGADATDLGVLETAAYTLGEASGCPIGDTSCNAWADLGDYAKLHVKMEGCDGDGAPNGSNPRIFINRLETEGQFNSDKEQAKCLVIPNAGTWAEDFYTDKGDGEYVIDLIKIKKEFGFVHFHSIKGSAWNTQAIVYDLEVEKASAAQQVGWTNLINNGDMEGDDVSSFFTKVAKGDPANSVITDGVGVNGSRGIKVEATAKESEAWDNQFWFRFNEPLLAGTKYRVSFDYRADAPAAVSTQAHAEPSDYIHWNMFGNIDFGTDWQTFTKEDEVTADQSTDAKSFLSVAFNLNELADANNYYFDNIKFEIYKYGIAAMYEYDAIQVDFGFETNISELVKAAGKKRVLFDTSCATVKVNGQEVGISSVEGFEDGRFFIFLDIEDVLTEDDIVEVWVNNTIGLVYTSGANSGNAVDNFHGFAEPSELGDDAYAYIFVAPTLMKSEPEDGSFNLDANTPITLYFDKNVDCSVLEVTANGTPLTISPNSGFAEIVTATGTLPKGECAIVVDKIYPEMLLGGDYDNTDSAEPVTITISVGKSAIDTTLQPEEIIPISYFNDCVGEGKASGSVPEGYILYADGDTPEQRMAPDTYGGGARMMGFAAGGDFTKGLYMRTWFLEYGTMGGYELNLVEGTKYRTSFNSCQWAGAGHWMKFALYRASDVESESDLLEAEPVFSKMVENSPNVNEQVNAVNGSTVSNIDWVATETGKYVARWIVCTGAGGDPTKNVWQNGVILANVKMMSMPNTAGYEYILLLNTALENAQQTLEGNSDERYLGDAFSALSDAIAKYQAEKDSYTSPSQFKEAADALDAAAQELKNHRQSCDEYDKLIKQAIDVVRQNEMPNGDPSQATKFTKTDLFNELKGIVAKYNGSSEWQNLGDEENPNWQLFYEYDELKDDDVLKAAIDALSGIVTTTSLLFTEGFSAPENANGGKATGVAVLTERLRLGAESLKALPGVTEVDDDIIAAKNALTDDDALAARLQQRIKARVYNELNSGKTTLFEPILDEATMEETTEPVDMTVYVKNPNIYKLLPNTDYSVESVPGWIVPEGNNNPGLTVGWGAAKNVEGVAEDCMFQTWGPSYRVEQTIANLPAGVYTVKFAFGERMNDDAANFEGSYAYVQTSDGSEEQSYQKNAEGDITDDPQIPGIGQSFPFTSNNNQVAWVEDVMVEDGVLTIGVNAGSSSHTFFNEVRVLMTAPLPGYVYPKMEETKQGDVNGDGAVDVADISNIITIMAAGATDMKGDVNGDGVVDVADISKVISIMAANARAAGKMIE